MKRIAVAVLDMQPIEPAVGGGRLRLLGLYHGLGSAFDTRYVGTFDWPGEQRRELKLSETLTETDVPLSAAHFAEDARWRQWAGGMNIIDTAFPILGRLSPGYVEAACEAVAASDVVIISHPWAYPLVEGVIDRRRQLLVYDAHNVESVLRWELLGDRPFNREIAKGVVVNEALLARASDLVVVCADTDLAFFGGAFGVPPERLYVAPNGVFTGRIRPADPAAHADAKASLGIRGLLSIFVGSNYAPNIEAVRFIAEELCPRFPAMTFAACGGVGTNDVLRSSRPRNLLLPGVISDEEKLRYLHAADMAVNPMFSGSGTNIKMFDFMAAGLPIVSTPAGARGIAERSCAGMVIAGKDEFADALAGLLRHPARLRALGRASRRMAEEDYSWERISPAMGHRLQVAVEARRMRPTGPVTAAGSPGMSSCNEERLPASVEHPGPIAIMSTWGVRCGIAEYSAYLTAALARHGVPVVILGNGMAGFDSPEQGSHARTRLAGLFRVWKWDNVNWRDGQVDFEAARSAIAEAGCRALNIQYHVGFFPEESLLRMVSIVRDMGIPVSVTAHNTRQMSAGTFDELAKLGARILVHNRKEAESLAGRHPGGVRHLLHGVLEAEGLAAPRDFREVQRAPVISTFGFLRPHKGLLQLVRAFETVRRVFPGARLAGQCSMYPTADSEEYRRLVEGHVGAFDLAEVVDIDFGFNDIARVIEALAKSDLIVLPYSYSDEGASGSLAIAIASRRPMLITDSPVFEDVAEMTYVASNNEPEVLAAAMATVLANSGLYADLVERADRFSRRASWARVALDFLEKSGFGKTALQAH